MIKPAEKAVSEERLMNAAFYFRATEFYILQDDSEKSLMYDKFNDLFYKVFKDDGIERFKGPYKNSFLPAIKIPIYSGKDKKGTISMHERFESFIEEFYSIMRYFSDHGYEVIAFECPGQCAALRRYGLAMDYRWEKTAKTILDYFELDNVT